MPDLVIDVLDVIGYDFFGEGITAARIAEKLAEKPDAKDILVRVNSPGGDVFEGTAIYNMLRGHGAEIRTEVHGLAASMGSIIALAGDQVAIAKNAMMMIHNPWGLAIGEAKDMRKRAELLDKIRAALTTTYTDRTGMTEEEIHSLMDEETWMTGVEAVEMDFADETFNDREEPPSTEEAAARTFAMLSKFRRPPASLLNKFETDRGHHLVAAMAKRQEKPITNEENRMNRAAILALLSLPEDASDESIRSAVEQMKHPDLKEFVPRADYDKARADLATEREKLQALQTAVEADRMKRLKADAAAAVDAACKAGKITPASKDYHLKVAQTSEEALAEFRSFVSGQVQVIDSSQSAALDRKDHVDGNGSALTSAEQLVCEQLGLTAEEYVSTRKTTQNSTGVYGA